MALIANVMKDILVKVVRHHFVLRMLLVYMEVALMANVSVMKVTRVRIVVRVSHILISFCIRNLLSFFNFF